MIDADVADAVVAVVHESIDSRPLSQRRTTSSQTKFLPLII